MKYYISDSYISYIGPYIYIYIYIYIYRIYNENINDLEDSIVYIYISI